MTRIKCGIENRKCYFNINGICTAKEIELSNVWLMSGAKVVQCHNYEKKVKLNGTIQKAKELT